MDTAWFTQFRTHHVVLGDDFIIAVVGSTVNHLFNSLRFYYIINLTNINFCTTVFFLI